MDAEEGFFGERVAAFCDERSADASTPEVVGPVVEMLAGMELEDRWAGWKREPFTALSTAHVSVHKKP